MIDVNLKGALYGIAAALPVFQRQNAGHVVNIVSTAGLKIVPTMGVYAATKNAMRTATEALRQEAGPHLRMTEVSPGFIDTDFAGSISDPGVRAAIVAPNRSSPSHRIPSHALSLSPSSSRPMWRLAALSSAP